MILTMWKFVPLASWIPFVGIVRTEPETEPKPGLGFVMVRVWVVIALPGPSSTTWPKLMDWTF